MKKIKSVICLLAMVSVLSNCSDKLTLDDTISSFEEFIGESIDRNEKPVYQIIGAKDGIIFYYEGSPVKIYEYESASNYKNALERYPMMKEWPVIGAIALETSKEDVIAHFESLR